MGIRHEVRDCLNACCGFDPVACQTPLRVSFTRAESDDYGGKNLAGSFPDNHITFFLSSKLISILALEKQSCYIFPMKFLPVLLIIIALVYIISPYDLLPDFFPVTGWFDDAFLMGILIYYLKYRRLPGFLAWLMGSRARPDPRNHSQTSGRSDTENKAAHTNSRDPYQVLGLKPGASPDEIRAAYRLAAQAYHPDKVAHLGPELRELAQKKFVEIQQAYDALIDKPK